MAKERSVKYWLNQLPMNEMLRSQIEITDAHEQSSRMRYKDYWVLYLVLRFSYISSRFHDTML